MPVIDLEKLQNPSQIAVQLINKFRNESNEILHSRDMKKKKWGNWKKKKRLKNAREEKLRRRKIEKVTCHACHMGHMGPKL